HGCAAEAPSPQRRKRAKEGMTKARHGQGILFVMTGASGVGKDTIRRAAMPRMTNLEYSISATTRPRRQGEEDGVQYRFLQRPTFERMIRDDELLEHADYVGDYYGTPARPVRSEERRAGNGCRGRGCARL